MTNSGGGGRIDSMGGSSDSTGREITGNSRIRVGARGPEGEMRVNLKWNAHLTTLSLWGKNKLWNLMRGKSYQWSRSKFFERSGTCADCVGRAASAKQFMFQQTQPWRQPWWVWQNNTGENNSHACRLAVEVWIHLLPPPLNRSTVFLQNDFHQNCSKEGN